MSSNELSDHEVEESHLTKIIAAPLQFVKTIFPLYSTGDVSQESQDDYASSEMVGNKLRLKRGRMKNKMTVQDKLIHHNRVSNHGCQRSVVRYIGSNVPLKPSKRAYYQLFEHSRRTIINSASTFLATNLDHVRQHVDQVKHHVVPTLADLGQLVWDDINVFVNEDDDSFSDEETERSVKEAPLKPAISNEDPNKLSALEDELAKLRAQIAAIVSNRNAPNTAAPTAQIAVVQPTSMLPPPPPPPPLPPIYKSSNAPTVCLPSIKVVSTCDENKSSMDDVLKGLSNVKLKNSNICRSPGGTPLKKNDRLEDLSNPADIIAKALKEKFQNSNMYRSPDGENSSLSDFSPSPQKNASRPVPKPRPRPSAQKKILDT